MEPDRRVVNTRPSPGPAAGSTPTTYTSPTRAPLDPVHCPVEAQQGPVRIVTGPAHVGVGQNSLRGPTVQRSVRSIRSQPPCSGMPDEGRIVDPQQLGVPGRRRYESKHARAITDSGISRRSRRIWISSGPP